MGSTNHRTLQLITLGGVAVFLGLGVSVVANGAHKIFQRSFVANGPNTKQFRSVGPFDRIESGSIFSVDVTIGSHDSLVFEAPRDLLPHLTSRIDNGTLRLGSNIDHYSLSGDHALKAHITVRHLRGVDVSGAGKLIVTGQVRESSFDANVSGAASLHMSAVVDTFRLQADGGSQISLDRLSAQTLNLQASGAANCSIAGTTSDAKIEAEGAANVHGKSLAIGRANISASGAAIVHVHVVKQLNAEASGASNVGFSGNPNLTKDTSGVAKIQRDR